jgi:hypothetical protein
VVWTITGSMTARTAVWWDDSDTTTPDGLICYCTFATDVTATDDDWTLSIDANGVVNLDCT